MPRDVNAQLRITAWPATPLPLPDTHRVESRLAANEGVIVPCPRGRYGSDWEEEVVALNGETYLRLADVDLDDPEAILSFVATYGPLGGADAYRAFMREAAFRIANVYRGQLDPAMEDEKKKRVLREEQRGTTDSVWPSDTLRFHFTETLDEFRFAARCLRDFTSAWQMFRDGTAASNVHWISPQQSDPELLNEDAFPLILLSVMLPECFLRSFSPHISFHWSPLLPAGPLSDLPPRHGGTSIDPSRRPLGAPLYSICALELFNHIVGNAEYRICANERCRRTFVHQHGRSEKSQRRSRGVLYCSPSCARATAQRDYRRRRKLKRSD